MSILLSFVLAGSCLAGCSAVTVESTDEQEKSGSEYTAGSVIFENTVYGKVSMVGEDTLTIRLGTIDMDLEEDTLEEADPEQPGDIDFILTGEKVTIQFKDDTVIGSLRIDGRMDGESEISGGSDGEINDGEIPVETIALEDIAEGDIVSITLDEDGYAETTTVLGSDNEAGSAG